MTEAERLMAEVNRTANVFDQAEFELRDLSKKAQVAEIACRDARVALSEALAGLGNHAMGVPGLGTNGGWGVHRLE